MQEGYFHLLACVGVGVEEEGVRNVQGDRGDR